MPRLRPRAILTAADIPARARRPGAAADLAADAPGPGAEASPEGYLSRLVKYIPAEAITVHGAVQGFTAGQGQEVVDMVMATTGYSLLALVPLWVLVMTRAPGEAPAWHQLAISTLAFAVWLAATGSPAVASLVPGWRPFYGSIAMVACVVIVFPLIEQLARRFSSPA